MAKAQLDAVLEHILRPFHERKTAALSDGQLLERFLRERDEGAFTVLVQRHAALVMTVARRVLHDTHDAEDVFQATFLLLARKAGSIRQRRALAGWLCRVAHHLALKAGAEKLRRHTQQWRVGTMLHAAPDTALQHEELCAVLDQELSQLPEKYRTPLVLHYLEGKSKDETAGQLGWTEGTVSGRLARARKLLHSRLVRRGFVLSSASMATILVEHTATATVSPLLLSATVDAAIVFARGTVAAETISASVAGLAEGMAKRISLAKIKMAAVLVLAMSVLGGGAGLTAYRAMNGAAVSQQTEKQEQPVAKKEAETGKQSDQPTVLDAIPLYGQRTDNTPTMLSASGRVVNTQGQPIPGATVYLREWSLRRRRAAAVEESPNDVLSKVATDADGRFAFKDVRAEPFAAPYRMREHPWDIVVLAQGHALSWTHLTPKAREGLLTMTLVPERPLQGRVTDPSGKPISGARVRVLDVAPLKRPYLAQVEGRPGYLYLQDSRITLAAQSDQQGAFTLAGLPADSGIGLQIQAPGHVIEKLIATTTDQPQPNLVGRSYANGIETTKLEPVYSGMLVVKLEPGRRLRGRVVCEDSGKPATVGQVIFRQGDQHRYSAEIDATGRVVLNGLPPGNGMLSTWITNKTDYLEATTTVVISPDKEPEEQELRLPRGTVVTGKVVNDATGKPVAGALLSYEYKAPGANRFGGNIFAGKADPSGIFRVVLRPGSAELRAYLFAETNEGFISAPPQRFEVKPSEPITGVQFRVASAARQGIAVTGRVLDSKGDPVKGAELFLCDENNAGWRPAYLLSDDQGRFTITGLPTNVSYDLVVQHKERKLGTRVTLPQDVGQKRLITLDLPLQPLAGMVGRLLDENRTPIAGARLTIYATRHWGSRSQGTEVDAESLVTDAEGRFAYDLFIPYTAYGFNVSVQAEGYAGVHCAEFKLVPGERHTVPDLIAPTAKQSVAGMVVDQDGKPLANVRVLAHCKDHATGQFLSSGYADLTREDGHFEITGLPKALLELSGELYVAGSREHDGRHFPPPTIKAETGQKDVRIRITVPPQSFPKEAVPNVVAPGFPTAKWLNRPDTPAQSGFVPKDFHDQVVLLAFLGETKPSQRILRQLNSLTERFAAKGLVIVRVYERPVAEAELATLSPIAAALVQPGRVAGGYSEAAQKYGVKAMPMLFLIDRKGILRQVDVELEESHERIEELLRK